MKLKSFRIKNYKSIIDSNECRLSDSDNIIVFAGQNESGKSSILQALNDYEKKTVSLDSFRDDDSLPSIACTYIIKDDDNIAEDIVSDVDLPDYFEDIITNIKEITIERTFKESAKYIGTIGNEILIKNLVEYVIASNVKIDEKNKQIFEENKKINEANKKIEEENKLVLPTDPKKKLLALGKLHDKMEIEDTLNKVSDAFWGYTPKIIFFDDFCDLLPDKILLQDIKNKNTKVNGYQAVINIETLLGANFAKLDDLNDAKRKHLQMNYHEVITATFNEKWKQRIAEGDGAKIHIEYNQGKSKDASYLNFYIETTKNQFLSPGKRSQGFKWFLSFFLHLKAEAQRTTDLIILFDEPGLFLHSKAQSDMISVFEDLSESNQILYTTHSPYLIDAKKLHRVRLVVNTKKFGTTIEKITSNKIKNQRDALKPIIDALGLEVVTPFSIVLKHNAIVEGISDFHYMQAMKKILNKDYDLAFIPSMGSSNCHLLMELCIGWGLDWIIIFDDKGAVKDYNKIKKEYFNNVDLEIEKKVLKLKDCDGIEDMFTVSDMKLVNPDADFTSVNSNSEIVKNYGGKELYSRLFYEKVNAGEITKEKISKTTIKKFTEVFAFIENAMSLDFALPIESEVNAN